MRLLAGGPANAAPPPRLPPPAPARGGRPYVQPPRGDAQPSPRTGCSSSIRTCSTAAPTRIRTCRICWRPLSRPQGLEPLSPAADHPDFDAAWVDGDVAYVAEVKSLTAENEEKQLRLGLGQLLSCLYRLEWEAGEVRGVLAVEREPVAPYWVGLCAAHNVILTWPDEFPGLFDQGPWRNRSGHFSSTAGPPYACLHRSAAQPGKVVGGGPYRPKTCPPLSESPGVRLAVRRRTSSRRAVRPPGSARHQLIACELCPFLAVPSSRGFGPVVGPPQRWRRSSAVRVRTWA